MILSVFRKEMLVFSLKDGIFHLHLEKSFICIQKNLSSVFRKIQGKLAQDRDIGLSSVFRKIYGKLAHEDRSFICIQKNPSSVFRKILYLYSEKSKGSSLRIRILIFHLYSEKSEGSSFMDIDLSSAFRKIFHL